MSNAIGQSATDLAVSPNGESSYDFRAAVERVGTRTAKGLTRERAMINRNKLVSGVCADYRMHFPAIYGKTERLPSEVFGKIDEAVDKYLTGMLSTVNFTNAISMRRSFKHKPNDLCFVEAVNLVGENQLTLQEQKLGCTLAIGAAEKRLADLQAKPTPDYEREKAIKAQLMKLTLTKDFIEGEIRTQEKLKIEASE